MTLARRALLGAVVVLALAPPPAHAAGEPTQQTWHGKQIRMYGAQSAGRDGAGVKVAVLDGWIDRSHPDFEGRVLSGADCRSGKCKAGLTKENCGSQHGTHVAGTVASSNLGVAPRATIIPVQVLSADSKGECSGTPAAVAAGIHYALAQGARVLNLSLGPDTPGGTSKVIPDAVHEAAQAGAVVVFSAGNADLPISQSYGNDALVVAATAPSGALASYTQYGSGVSVAAPGGQPDGNDQCTVATCVLSLYPGNQIAVAAGTSMAAPHVSGLAALLFGQAPGRSRDTVIAKIENTAHALNGAGHGLIDVKLALGVKSTTPAPAPTHTPTRKPVVRVTSKPATQPTSKPSTVTTQPSPSAAPTTATPTTPPPSTVATVSPTPTFAAAPVLPAASKDDDVPVPYIVVAVLLLVINAAGVLSVGLRS